jgi:hypothetical protein
LDGVDEPEERLAKVDPFLSATSAEGDRGLSSVLDGIEGSEQQVGAEHSSRDAPLLGLSRA